ncbi:FAD-binding oxidoreductase [Bacillus sp. CECT 9360]|uniref:FAD-binding oxidoreductase n=1 Tax=Bacillus sp. CECT 9360 TaxID=2845821 RepID=UPI001E401C0D|nr:FAD-binding oxidoreductase [Bacillus sp. CECT 9360]CAH0346589.1 Decaprenylphosphoryl-beta-D-ribose oxidase [Bacillus sp. CECT 9360]
MKKKFAWDLLLLLAIYCAVFGSSLHLYQTNVSHPEVEDKGRLLPVKVKSIEHATEKRDFRQLIEKNDKISIAGMQHSQGGHTYYPNAIMIDMKNYNKILDLDLEEKTITVQSGATWDDIQRHINPHGLAVKVMQSQNIFTVGGSLSVNVHGRDIRNDALIDTVKSFRLMNANGQIINVSRTENSELFPLVIGGYGLFGIILDVTLQLTDDELYKIRTKTINYKDYASYFEKEVKNDNQVRMHMSRISVAPDSLLKEMYITDYIIASDQKKLKDFNKLKEENIIALPKFFLGLSRHSDWGKNVFWNTQKSFAKNIDGDFETRNNVMRSDSLFMEYDHAEKTEVLQEYFVPVNEFADYIDGLRTILEKEDDFNLLNITVRYVEKNDHSVMSFSKDNMFALVLLINQGTSAEDIKKTKQVINDMLNLTLEHNGSYYLPYYSYPTKQQFKQAYPRSDEFFQLKRKYDPEERFQSLFYEEYKK